ncbi:CYC2-like cyclin 6, putative [Trypanosoma cruzi marinkellei]|uniref:CYC2-like cyclin 6, putative n=1 Tax=Trypanosoma cruzi marinkellei TaxID=85056 RepID=K2NM44_TRYCR|nr:CYC2-like cyclin 6, putative [Trypanosoma cruzi marinkellei]
MTALSLALGIHDEAITRFGSKDFCDAVEVEAAAVNAHQYRMFLLAMESLLQRQWEHYSFHGGNPITKLRQLEEKRICRYFPVHCMNMEGHGCRDERKHRTLVGSGAAGPLIDFIYRLICHSHCSIECYPITLALTGRFFVEMRKESATTEYEAAVDHLPCVFAVLLLITAKYRDDNFRSNRYFSQLAELSLMEWNALERLVIRVLRFNVNVPIYEYIAYEKLLLKEMMRQEEKKSVFASIDQSPRSEKMKSLMHLDSKIDISTLFVDHVEVAMKDNASFHSCGVTASSPSLRSQCPLLSVEDSPVSWRQSM